MKRDTSSSHSVIEEVSSYISRSGEAKLPAEVIREAKHHILDTLSAIVSGSKLKPGQLARKFIESQGGVEEAQVIGSPMVTSAINAAFANGIMAHADETDDSHSPSGTHPGCGIVPAALSMSDREEADGMSFLKGVVAGYDIGCRSTQALGITQRGAAFRGPSLDSHSIGNNFGAATAATAILRLRSSLVRYVLSYIAQQASGATHWVRDKEHMEKAFIWGGMPARNGVTAAILVQSGFTGVRDLFSGENNFFEAISSNSEPELLTKGLGSHYEITITSIKKFPVGFPIQAPLEALLLLIKKHGFTFKDVQSVIARLPSWGARTVGNRNMPDIDLRYILAVTLLDGDLTFETAHSFERMNSPAVLDAKKRVKLVADPELSTASTKRQGIVEITTRDGAKFREHVVSVHGFAESPMTTEEVENKCRKLLTPVLGEGRSQKLIDKIWNLEKVSNMRELRPLLSVS